MTDEADAADAVDEQDAAVDDAAGVDDQQHDQDDEQGDGEQVDADELKARVAEAEADARRWKRRAAESDRATTKYRSELAKLQKPRGEDDGGQKAPDDRVAELERRLAEKTAAANESTLRTEFYGLSKHDWQDRKVAYRLLDASDVQDEDGVVDSEALTDAADKLAKDHPYLLKTATLPKPRSERPTGQQPGAGRKDRTTVDTDALKRRFPVLNARH